MGFYSNTTGVLIREKGHQRTLSPSTYAEKRGLGRGGVFLLPGAQTGIATVKINMHAGVAGLFG